MTEPLRIQVGWPAKELGSNSAGQHRMVTHRFRKALRTEANWATRITPYRQWSPTGERIKVHLICSVPRGTVQPDDDGMVFRAKSALDGIADALGVNDRTFEAPTVEWIDKSERGSLIVELS